MTPQERAVVAAFAEEARRFVTFVAEAGALPLDARTEQLAARLAALYAAGLALPPVDADVVGDAPDEGAARTWAGVAEQSYWYVYEPFVDEPPVVGDIDDDVLGIVGDLRRGLAAWARGEEAPAACEWRFSFQSRWGEHAVDCLRVAHRLVERARRGEA